MSVTRDIIQRYAERMDVPQDVTTISRYLRFPAVIPEEFDRFQPRIVVGFGGTAVALQRENGLVLKLGQPIPEMIRFFDIPMLDSGVVGRVPYVVQPFADMSATEADAEQFDYDIGYEWCFVDPGPEQIGYYKGNLRLVDYEAVDSAQLGDVFGLLR